MQTNYEITCLSTTTRAANTTHSQKLDTQLFRENENPRKKTLDMSPLSELIC